MRTLEFAKNNYGAVSAKIAVRYQNGVFVPVDMAANQAERAQVAEDLYIEIAGILIAQGENLSANKTAVNYAVTIVYDHPKGKEFIGTQGVEAARQRVLADNKIHIKIDARRPRNGDASRLDPSRGPIRRNRCDESFQPPSGLLPGSSRFRFRPPLPLGSGIRRFPGNREVEM